MKNIFVIILNNNGKDVRNIVTQVVEHVNLGIQIVLIVLSTFFIVVAIYFSYAKKLNYGFFFVCFRGTVVFLTYDISSCRANA